MTLLHRCGPLLPAAARHHLATPAVVPHAGGWGNCCRPRPGTYTGNTSGPRLQTPLVHPSRPLPDGKRTLEAVR